MTGNWHFTTRKQNAGSFASMKNKIIKIHSEREKLLERFIKFSENHMTASKIEMTSLKMPYAWETKRVVMSPPHFFPPVSFLPLVFIRYFIFLPLSHWYFSAWLTAARWKARSILSLDSDFFSSFTICATIVTLSSFSDHHYFCYQFINSSQISSADETNDIDLRQIHLFKNEPQ